MGPAGQARLLQDRQQCAPPSPAGTAGSPPSPAGRMPSVRSTRRSRVFTEPPAGHRRSESSPRCGARASRTRRAPRTRRSAEGASGARRSAAEAPDHLRRLRLALAPHQTPNDLTHDDDKARPSGSWIARHRATNRLAREVRPGRVRKWLAAALPEPESTRIRGDPRGYGDSQGTCYPQPGECGSAFQSRFPALEASEHQRSD